MDISKIPSVPCSDESGAALCDALSRSLFYYCSGVDPTPVIALFSEYPLFIYSDLLRRYEGGVDEAAQILLSRLAEHGFRAVTREHIELGEGAVLILLEKDGARAQLLLVKGDAWRIYRLIYGEGGAIRPRCIANIRYEMDTRHFLPIEREVEYILGYSYSREHTAERKFKYFGDYSEKEVTLFRRR